MTRKPGDLTDEAIERRLHRAILTLDATADPDARFRAPPQSACPDWIRDYHATHDPETLRSAIPAPARFQPTPEDVDDMLTALTWITLETRWHYPLMRARAYGHSFQAIANVRGRTKEHWRRTYRQTLETVADEARRQESASRHGLRATRMATGERNGVSGCQTPQKRQTLVSGQPREC